MKKFIIIFKERSFTVVFNYNRTIASSLINPISVIDGSHACSHGQDRLREGTDSEYAKWVINGEVTNVSCHSSLHIWPFCPIKGRRTIYKSTFYTKCLVYQAFCILALIVCFFTVDFVLLCAYLFNFDG